MKATPRRRSLLEGAVRNLLQQSILMSRIRFRWPWQKEGRHYKLMLATSIAVVILVPILLLWKSYVAAVAVVLWLLTLAVQWLCIEPPDVEEKDLH